MSLRTAGKQSPILLAAVLLFAGWVAVSVFRVYGTMSSIWTGTGGPGQTELSGLIGILVLLAIAGLLVALYGAMSESGPVPESFPPGRETR